MWEVADLSYKFYTVDSVHRNNNKSFTIRYILTEYSSSRAECSVMENHVAAKSELKDSSPVYFKSVIFAIR